jgi:D-glycero-beta-D-manno-heptose-7-phosphate kinase
LLFPGEFHIICFCFETYSASKTEKLIFVRIKKSYMTQDPELEKILYKFKNLRILIVGDVMVDEYLWGEVNRISPEAPVPVVSCIKREYRMGGAANVAVNIKSLEAEPVICSVTGDDETGEIFQQLLREQKIAGQGIITTSGRRTTRKTRVIGNHQHLMRIDHESTDNINKEMEMLLLEKVNSEINRQKPDAIVFQDYDKGVITGTLIAGIVKLAGELRIPVLVDPKRKNFLSYERVDLFKPNFKELNEGLGISLQKSDYEGIFSVVRKLHASNAIKNIMITLSEMGVFVSDGLKYKVIPAEVRDIADVSGAGDTVIAVASLGLACGLDIFTTARLSNQAGGLVCEKVGVVPVTRDLFLSGK